MSLESLNRFVLYLMSAMILILNTVQEHTSDVKSHLDINVDSNYVSFR